MFQTIYVCSDPTSQRSPSQPCCRSCRPWVQPSVPWVPWPCRGLLGSLSPSPKLWPGRSTPPIVQYRWILVIHFTETQQTDKVWKTLEVQINCPYPKIGSSVALPFTGFCRSSSENVANCGKPMPTNLILVPNPNQIVTKSLLIRSITIITIACWYGW